LSEILIEFAGRTAAGFIFAAEFLFLGYPLVRKYLENQGFFPQLVFSHVLSASIAITVVWAAYTGFRSIVPLEATSAVLVTAGTVGTARFVYDFTKQRRTLTHEGWGFALLVLFTVLLAVSSAVSLPFIAQGDAYGYYVPLGRYLNQNPGAYVNSFYRFSLSRNFAYYAVYAHADILGGSVQSYLLLPIPFVLGTLFGVIAVAKKLTSRDDVPLVAASLYVFSVYFGILLKFDMFYLGNLFMSTIALYYCYFLLTGARRALETAALALSTFAVLLLYDFALLLIVPLALGYLALRKPRLTVLVVAGLAFPLVLAFSFQDLSLGFVSVQKMDLESSIAFMGLVVIVIAGIGRRGTMPRGASDRFYPTLLTFLAAGASLLVQRIVDLWNYGFQTLENITLSSPVIAYMQRNYWFYTTPPDIPGTLFSIFFSDVFFGWGLLFTVYGLLLSRGKPAATFFLTTLPLMVLVETINKNYSRFGLFLAPLIVVFLATGLCTLTRRNTLVIGFCLSFVALIGKALTTFPNLDYEHRALANPLDMVLFSATVAIATAFYIGRRRSLSRFIPSRLSLRFYGLTSKIRAYKSISTPKLLGILIIALCVPVLTYNVLSPKYTSQIYNSDVTLLQQQVIPLIQEKSVVLTVELVHPNFEFYRDAVVIEMAQPWILQSFLNLGLSNVTALLSWLRMSGVHYVFMDRDLTSANTDVFSLFDQLSVSYLNYSQCTVQFDNGRFVLLEISA
jgi:hypothetical protein